MKDRKDGEVKEGKWKKDKGEVGWKKGRWSRIVKREKSERLKRKRKECGG